MLSISSARRSTMTRRRPGRGDRLRSTVKSIPTLALLTLSIGCADVAPGAGVDIDIAAVDSIFAALAGTDNPGCAVGVSLNGREVLARAYGLADLEHDMPNTPVTVFEPGSVSKQFVAAATVLLAVDSRISLGDDVRDYVPELPDYGEVITVRDLLSHTSGLRDWGSIAGIHGWQRTTRRHTHTHMLDITRRQKSLNYPPGEYYSYTNTGYNLLSVLVERVTGMTLDEYSQERLFGPLGMTRTQWRDDFTEVVRHRSTAYRPTEDGTFHQLMPFENVYGNGGLLSTVGDLLRFTHNLETGDVGGPRFVEEMHRQGVLDSGRKLKYAAGIFIDEYRGVPEVHHAGATAGYGGFLTRFPEQGVAVAVMCNVSGANPGGLAHEVADLYLAGQVDENIPPGRSGPPVEVDLDALEAFSGGYRDTFAGGFVPVTVSEGQLRAAGVPLTPVSPTRFEGAGAYVLEFDEPASEDSRPSAFLMSQVLDRARLEPIEIADPSPEQLAEYVGAYRSEEAEVTYWIEVDGGQLRSRQRYDVTISLTPAYEDAFTGFGATFIFDRDGSGRVTGFTMSRGRVWGLGFERLP